MTDTTTRLKPADAPQEEKREPEKAPDLVQGINLADARVAFQDAREKPAEGLPVLHVGDKAQEGEAKKLTPEEKERAQYLQTTLSDMAPLFSDKADHMQKAIKAEMDKGEFGEASQKAFAEYLKFLDDKTLLTIKEWSSLKPTEALPPGCPIHLTPDKYRQMITPELFRSLASANELSSSWKLDSKLVPTNDQLEKIDGAFDWLATCNRSMNDARNEFRDRTLNELIKENGLPEGWLRKEGDNREAWCASAEEMIDLGVRTRNYVSAMQSLFKASKDSDFPMVLPPNARITVDVEGKKHEVSGANIYTPEARHWLKNGNVTEVVLDLPTDLRQEEPANKEKIRAMREWLTKYGDKIDQAVGEMAKLQANPDSIIMFGDQEISNGKGVFNANGEFSGIVNDRYVPRQGERLEEVNLVGYDFNVEKIEEGPNKGKYRITQNIQAENAPIWAYLNIRALGIDKVGKPMKLEEKIVGGEDFVWVKNGDKIEMVKGSNLASFKKMQQLHYYGEKALVATMDAAMLASGTIELRAAFKGAQLAAAGANAALKLTARQAFTQGSKAAVKMVVAGAGVLNNAGARATEEGRFINNARAAYFIGDITQGVVRGGWGLAKSGVRWARGVEAAPQALSGAEKIHKIIHGGKLPDGKIVESLTPWVRRPHTVSNIAFRTTEVGFGYMVQKDLRKVGNEFLHSHNRDGSRDALAAVGDGRGLQVAEKGSFDLKNKDALDATRVVLDRYSSLLKDGKPAETQKKIDDIMGDTKKMLAPDADKDAKKKFVDTLANQATAYNADKDVQAAAQISLLYLSRDNDGKIPESITPYLKSSRLVETMQKDLVSQKHGSRQIATGDCLLRVGAMSHQSYGGLLQNVLRNPEASKSERMNALMDPFGARMATIVDGLRLQETKPAGDDSAVEKDRELGRQFGLTSADLLKTLESTAKNDKDGDVRALAAALLYGLNERNLGKRGDMLQKLNAEWQRSADKPGELTKHVNALLKEGMQGEGKLNAARTAALLADPKDTAAQKEINGAIARAINNKDAAAATAALDSLLPERLAQLDKDDPQLANQARVAALETIKKPETPEEERAVVNLLRKMEPFLKNGEAGNRTELVRRLHEMLSISAANKNYAREFPELRAAAIDTLAALGHQGSIDLIRTHAAAEKIKIKDQEIACAEPNALVRTAAVKALEQLKDAGLRSVVNELIQKETDPSVAAQLRDVSFVHQRIEPGTEEYSRIYQNALRDVIGDLSKHKHLDGFGSDAQLKWIRENYDLLDVDKYRERCNDAAKNAMGTVDRILSMAVTEKLAEQTKVFAVGDERWKQWEDLRKTAQGTGERADKAKMALFYILTHNGHPMGSEAGHKIQIEGDKYNERVWNHDWMDQAAHAFKLAAAPGCGSRDITAYCVRQALKEGSVKPWVSTRLLDAVKELGKPSRDGYVVSREQLARMTAEALTTELGRKHEDQADYYQQFLLKDLKDYRHRMIFPVIDAMAEKSKFPAVRKEAQDLLDEFRHSVNLIYDETPVDQTSAADARAARMRAALDDGNNAETTVQELFKAYKGYSFANVADPGIAFVHQALNDRNDRTKLAAAKIVLESKLPTNHETRAKAMQVLRTLSTNAAIPRHRTDAAAELNKKR